MKGDKVHIFLVLTKEHAGNVVDKLRDRHGIIIVEEHVERQRMLERIADTIERQAGRIQP